MDKPSLATFNLQVFSPEPEEDAPSLNDAEKRLLADLPAMIDQVQEEMQTRLPTGFRVRITEWSDGDV